MIILDIETSGLDPQENGIWQIGAIELENPKNQFLEEAKIDNKDLTQPGALEITNKTEEQLRDSNTQSQTQLLINFFEWVNKINIKMSICQNPAFDLSFIKIKAKKYNLTYPFHHRSLDLHSVAQTIQFKTKQKFKILDNKSDMGLSNILEFVGMSDNRNAHNALEDAKLTAECFSRLIYNKNLLEEYSQFKIPDYFQNKENNRPQQTL